MEYEEVIALFKYWRDNPPTHVLVKAFFQMGDDSKESSRPRSASEEGNDGEMSTEQFQEMISMFPHLG